MGSRSTDRRAISAARLGGILRLALAIALAIAAGMASAESSRSNSGFARFKHDRWTADEGAPTGIRGIAQTPDGYLWLASAQGLFRFDGVTFERIPAPKGSEMEFASPSAFVVTRKGELWVGYFQSGGVAMYRNGRLQDMHLPRPPAQISDMREGPDGSIWVGASDWSNRLTRYAAGRWEPIDDKYGMPPGALTSLAFARDGTLWMPMTKQHAPRSSVLAYLPPGAATFRFLTPPLGRWPWIAVDPRGALWISDSRGTRRLPDILGKAEPPAPGVAAVPGLRYPTLAFDRAGGIWGSTSAAGIFYIPSEQAQSAAVISAPLRFTAMDGLTSDVASFAFADREGSIWIGTALGLDRFRSAKVRRETVIPVDPIDGQLIASSTDGAVYIATLGTIFKAESHQAPRPIFRNSDKVTALCPARAGGVWAARSTQLFRIAETVKQRFAPPPGESIVLSCAEDGDGRLWLARMDGRLGWRDAAGWHDLRGVNSVDEITEAPGGDVAFRTATGEIGLIRKTRIDVRRAVVPKLRALSMLAPDVRDVFASGANALLRLRGTDIQRLDGAAYPWLAGLRGLRQTADGATWTLGRDGISRVATADLDRAFDRPGTPVPRRLFDARDGGLTTPQQAFYPGAQLASGRDGRMWFLDRAGAVSVEPATLTRNRLPPPVVIRSLASGGRVYRDPGPIVLPPGTRSLDIAYTATSLVVPRRVAFRYRLVGVDDGWVDPGGRRLASYANLAPGKYRFQVIAANDDGVWNRAGAALAIEIRPTFFQSWPFRALCLIALLAALWLVYRLRLRSVAERIRLRMAERMDERERIARELHDTLLQSVQALTLRFQLALDDLPATEPARAALEQAIDRADQVIAEGRDRVRDLRSRQDGNFEQIVRDLLARQIFGSEVATSVTVFGEPIMLHSSTLDEVVRIAAEAIFNVRRHAHAGRVTVEIRYAASFSLRVADDGIGIDPDVAERGGKDGHFGLAGMRERAAALQGDLLVRRRDAGGTELLLSVPGRVAYRSARTRRFGPFGRMW